MYTRYNALYAGYAWPVVKAAYGMVSAGQYMGRSCCCCSQPDLDTPNFPSRASSSSSAPNTLLQVCRLSVRLQWLPCIWPKVARECPVSTHSILVVFFLTSSAAHFNAACGPPASRLRSEQAARANYPLGLDLGSNLGLDRFQVILGTDSSLCTTFPASKSLGHQAQKMKLYDSEYH